MNKESLLPYKQIDWKIICHSKTSMNKLKWWYNEFSKEYWLFILSQDSNKIFILNALSGKYIKSLGSHGDAIGQFDTPSDMSIYDDYLFILERDNHRIQIFSLPELKFVGIIGEVELTAPNCLETIKLRKDNKNYCCVYVGDNLDNKPSRNKCYFKFILELNESGIYDTEVTRYEPKEKSQLGFIQSIKYDGVQDNLYIVDKLSKDVKIFNFNDQYKSTILKNYFKGNPGEINIIQNNIFIGDFSRLDNFFHIFSRNFKHENTLVSDKTLKNECFCIINHNNNLILYTADEDDEILAYRIYELNNKTIENNQKNTTSSLADFGITALLGTAVAAGAFYMKK
jgi:3-phytase